MATSMLVTNVGDECVAENFKILVTVLTVFVTNIMYLLIKASGINIEISSLTPENCYQHSLVTNIYVVLLYR